MIRHALSIVSIAAALAGPATLSAGAAEAPSDAARIVAAKRLLQKGFDERDLAALKSARGELLALLAAAPEDPMRHYWVAVADWRLVPFLSDPERGAPKRHVEEGLARCDAALAIDPRFGEALALKAGLQGMSIQFDGGAAMTIAPQMQANMAKAVELAPESPRVHLLDAINTFHTPAFFGGGADRALEKLEKARALYEAAAPTDSTAPDWGATDVTYWIRRALAKSEKGKAK